jgi:hypothetical protein
MDSKSVLLGENKSSARARLIKAILFSFLQRYGEDACFRCKEKIEKIEELSIEHKESWARAAEPVVAFFDLENISFSHLVCNSRNNGNRKVGPEGTSWCWDCKQFLPLDHFTKGNRSPERGNRCSKCSTKASKEYRIKQRNVCHGFGIQPLVVEAPLIKDLEWKSKKAG